MLLFHDAHHPDVVGGIDDVLACYGDRLVDGGLLSTHSTPESMGASGPERWGGLRMLRLRTTAGRS
jgi:hypothetical protein